jgi:hypothetical protein
MDNENNGSDFFPENSLGLRRGSVLESAHQIVQEQLGIRVGDRIVVGWDGTYVRCMWFTWDIEQLVDEINAGYWTIVGHADLSDPETSQLFKEATETDQEDTTGFKIITL